MRLVIKALDPEGVELRRARRLRRRQYHSRGPNALWHMDSYDKLKPYGIAINGCIDGFSRYIMWMEAYTTNSDPKVIADYYFSTVTRIGGCPQRMRADRGDFLDKNLVQFCFLNLLQLYGAAEDRLQCILPEEVAVCKEECTPKGQYPCDETFFVRYFIQDFWETSSSDPLPTFIAVKHVKKFISINRRKICQSIPEEILLLAAHKLKEACLQVTVLCPKQHFL
ncbi:hypothetical protein NQZ68_027313 [Dissostichus eleginoides]|nr:hypothetical protein NQZ68_027313 [Dissostichus eleginoides]